MGFGCQKTQPMSSAEKGYSVNEGSKVIKRH